MESVLSRLERRFGRFAIPNLTTYVVAGMAIGFVLGTLKPEVLDAMALDLRAIRSGQVWRLVSYLFIPRSTSLIWLVFQLSFTWFIGRTLEAEWGAFKLNLYYLLGMLGTMLAAVISGESVGNLYLNTTLFFAFATLFPDYQLTLYLIIPVRVKWLALLSLGALVLEAVFGSWGHRAGILAAMSSYFVFFGGTLVQKLRARGARSGASEPGRSSSEPVAKVSVRACSSCGALEAEGADIRVCTCEKCGIPTLFCLEHARKH
jgi:hypothetical protein